MKRVPAARRTSATLELSPDAAPDGGVEVGVEAAVRLVTTPEVVRVLVAAVMISRCDTVRP